MNHMADILFEYLRDIFYDASKAELDIDKLDEDFATLGKGLVFFAKCFSEYNAFAAAMAVGDLSVPPPPPENELASPLKSLNASLKHITWQTQQVAAGDYSQRVDFKGEFADAFNSMIRQLAERRQQLQNEFETIRKKTEALESGSHLLINITKQIPQQIIVADSDTREILFLNNAAKRTMNKHSGNLDRLLETIIGHTDLNSGKNEEIEYSEEDMIHYLSVISYKLEWHNKSATAFVIQDISTEKQHIMELEGYAYRDALTHLFNRFAGMLTLNKWLEQNKTFALVFADLDELKKINDIYGHIEGDRYIVSAAACLNGISLDAVACRIGGDEFMVLIPDADCSEADNRMCAALERLAGDEYLKDKEFEYHFSYGIVEVGADDPHPASELLSLADERMYAHKKASKDLRRNREKNNSINT